MSRTDATSVTVLFDTDLPPATVTSWIDIATEIVDDIASADSTLGSTRLEQIEKLLAAGFAEAQDPRIQQAKRESASVTYDRPSYMGQAARLDPTGTISGLEKPAAGMKVPDLKGLRD